VPALARLPWKKLFTPTAHSARKFHQTFPDYTPTPLVKLTHLADMLRVSNIWIKDESHRFGLNAFKVLGATHGLAYLLAQRLEMNTQELSFDLPHEPSAKEVLADTTLVTATDGNHGRAVAWARYESIKAHGAQTLIIDGTYDDAVKQAAEQAQKQGWILLQDTARDVKQAAEQAQKQGWILLQDTAREGYEEIPLKIMQGYLTILHEALEQLEGEIPTHVLVQCGVGSLAGL